MRNAGLAAEEYELAGFGTVAIHVGIKPVKKAGRRAGGRRAVAKT
jgi:hypothetical protein